MFSAKEISKCASKPVTRRDVFFQPKLTVNQPGDKYEQEADRMANQVMRMATPSDGIQRRCKHCEEEKKQIRRKESGDSAINVDGGFENYVSTLGGQGMALSEHERHFFEPRFNHDFSNVRIHTGSHAAESATRINARAYTTGNNIVFNDGEYQPTSENGKRLIAHELTHVVQQSDSGTDGRIQRFEASERGQISDVSTIISDAETFVEEADSIDDFVEMAGGQSISSILNGSLDSGPSNTARLENRYLVSCQCGMIDMRHFYQLMYIAATITNAHATDMGRDHELEAEATSRFAAEDTTSNALGAYFGANNINSVYTTVATFVDRLRTFLERCRPIDFNGLPQGEQDAIVSFYSARNSDGTPVNVSESATPAVLSISACDGYTRSFPYRIDSDDEHGKTIDGLAEPYSLTDDGDIREWVSDHSSAALSEIVPHEKLRLIRRLLAGWVADEDLDAVEAIYNNATDSDRQYISASINVTDLMDIGQRTRLRLLFN